MKNLKTLAGKDDDLHQEAEDETGVWGTAGAGCLVLCPETQRFLMGCRGKEVQQPLEWGGWGGAIDSREDPKAAAEREFREETSYKGTITKLVPLFIFRSGKFTYRNYLALLPKEFKPKLDWETSRAGWFGWRDWPGPQHFGLTAILQDQASIKTIERYLK